MTEMSIQDRAAVFMILEVADQGRPVEFMAQFLASYISSGELDTATTFGFIAQVLERTEQLLDNQALIWKGLLPGDIEPGKPWPEFELRVKDAAEHSVRVMVVSMTSPRGQGWVVYGMADAMWYVWDGQFFTNVSHPDSDQLSDGMIINVHDDHLVAKLPHEAADLICEIARS